MIQAVILAGGLGTRLRPLTYEIPKVLVPISGKPFLSYLILMLAENGIDDIVICAGHLGEQIVTSVGDGGELGCKIRYSFEKELLDTGGAIKNALSLLDDEFLVLNGDTYHPIDYKKLVEFWHNRKAGYDCLIVGYENKDLIVPNNIRADKAGTVEEYSKKELADGCCVDSGVQLFKKNVFNELPPNKRISLEKDVFVSIIRRGKMLSYITGIRYYDIGTVERIKAFEKYLQARKN